MKNHNPRLSLKTPYQGVRIKHKNHKSITSTFYALSQPVSGENPPLSL